MRTANQHDRSDEGWTYLTQGPFKDFNSYLDWMERTCNSDDPLFFAYVNKETNQAIRCGALMRTHPALGVIEIGNIKLLPLLQRRPMATEVMHLKMAHAFELGYRRYEWKSDVLNTPSRRAGVRLGFTFEGVFRKANHYKGRSRDTAWYSITDDEWPPIHGVYLAWLDASNFDIEGRQLRPLSSFLTKARPT